MEEKDFKRVMIIVVIIVLALLAILIIKPIFTPIVLALLIAYILNPAYKKFSQKIKSKNIAALVIVLSITIITLMIVIISIQPLSKQLINFYNYIKFADFSKIILQAFPTLVNSPETSATILAATSYITSNLSSWILNLASATIQGIPKATMGLIIFLFTLFFSLREGEDFKKYLFVLFPFPKEYQTLFSTRFDQVTNSVIYGHFIVGIAQGIIAGIGYFIFGVPNALLMTILTIIVGVVPVIGPWLIWMPLDAILFIQGETTMAIQLLIYGLFVVNLVDTLLRPQLVSSKAEMNSAIALIGMIGGTYAFGIVGFMVGPLLLAALILLVEIYRDKKPEESIVLKEPEKQPIP